jgi:hypothetical protein
MLPFAVIARYYEKRRQCAIRPAWPILMSFQRTEIPTKNVVKSLCWYGDALVDLVAGCIEYRLDGTTTNPRVNWAYRFDAAVRSASGQYTVIYEKLGTKGLLIRDGKLLRELNRSFYCAEAYEFPVTLASLPSGRDVLIHCPDEYNRIEIEDAETGEQLTADGNRKPADFFHSRLAVSGNGRWLLSAGWIWHPIDAVCCFDISAALMTPTVLDGTKFPDFGRSCEVNTATFVDNDRLLLSSGPEAEHFWNVEELQGLRPAHLGTFNLQENRFERLTKVDGEIGTMMPVGTDHIISFYEHPKLIDLRSGGVETAWPDVASGKQNSSIIWHHEPAPPPIAVDQGRRRFAVADQEKITVIELHRD